MHKLKKLLLDELKELEEKADKKGGLEMADVGLVVGLTQAYHNLSKIDWEEEEENEKPQESATRKGLY